MAVTAKKFVPNTSPLQIIILESLIDKHTSRSGIINKEEFVQFIKQKITTIPKISANRLTSSFTGGNAGEQVHSCQYENSIMLSSNENSGAHCVPETNIAHIDKNPLISVDGEQLNAHEIGVTCPSTSSLRYSREHIERKLQLVSDSTRNHEVEFIFQEVMSYRLFQTNRKF